MTPVFFFKEEYSTFHQVAADGYNRYRLFPLITISHIKRNQVGLTWEGAFNEVFK